MIVNKESKGYKPTFEVVSCFCEKEGRHVILQRTENVYMPLKWGPPAGKRRDGEELKDAVCREVLEETGIDIRDNEIKYFGKYYVSHGKANFVYYVFWTEVNTTAITLSEREHKNFAWVTPVEALDYPLIHDQDFVVKDFYKIRSGK